MDLLHACPTNNHTITLCGPAQINTWTFTLAECTHSLNSEDETLRVEANLQKIKSIHLPETRPSSESLRGNLMKQLTSEIIALSSAGLFDIATLSTLHSHRSQGAVGGRRCYRRRAPTSTFCTKVEKQLKAVAKFL